MNKWVPLFNDIRFWIILFFIIRLVGISNPPLEAAHSWRQTTVCMVARNFVEVDPNILYPRIDIAGEKTGITGMEFPILNFAIYGVSKVFGYEHWYGRLINLMVSSFGVLFFFRLVKKYFDSKLALNASLILIVSLWFSYSRKIMPDTFATSFVLMSLFYGLSFFDDKQKLKHLILYFLFGLLGLLSKVPVIFLYIIFLLPIFKNNYSIRAKLLFSLTSVVMLAPVFAWYFYWVPYLVQEFGFWHFFMGGSFTEGVEAVTQNMDKVMKHFYANSIKYIGFVFFMFGLGVALYKKEKRLLLIFGLLFFSFLIIVLKSGDTFIRHSYYMVPLVPIMALITAYGLSQLKHPKLILFIMLAIIFEGVLNQHQDFVLTTQQRSLISLEKDLDVFSERSDLVLINSGFNPTPMYFAHRKGRVENNAFIRDADNRRMLNERGYKFIVVLKNRFGSNVDLPLTLLLENTEYKIYQNER